MAAGNGISFEQRGSSAEGRKSEAALSFPDLTDEATTMARKRNQPTAEPGGKPRRKSAQETQKAEPRDKLAEKLSLTKRKQACEPLGGRFPEQCDEPLSEAAAPNLNAGAKKRRS